MEVFSMSTLESTKFYRIKSTPNFPESKHLLPPFMHTYLCVLRDKKYLLFGKFDVLCFVTAVLRFSLLPYYWKTFSPWYFNPFMDNVAKWPKNLTVNTARFLSVAEHFRTFCIKELKLAWVPIFENVTHFHISFAKKYSKCKNSYPWKTENE